MYALKTLVILFSVIIVFIAANNCSAEEEDPFSSSEFDSVITKVNTVPDQSSLTFLGGVSFASEGTSTYPIESDKSATDLRFFGKPFAKLSRDDIGALFLSTSFNYFLLASSNSELLKRYYKLQKADPSKVELTLSEFHLSFDINKKVFIRIGNQLISWGASYFWSPEDFINRQKNQLSALSAVDIRSGKPGIRIHIPFEKSNLFFFTDFSKVTANGSVNSLMENIAQAWRFDATIANVNVGTVGYVSADSPLHIGLDATGNVLTADVYGELALTFNNDSEQTAPAFSAGFSKVFGEEKTWTFRSEVYYNDTGFGDTTISTLRAGEFTPLYSGKFYVFTELTTSKLFTSMISSSLLYYMNCIDRSFSSTLLFTFDFPKVLPFTLYLRANGGRLDREFTGVFADRTLTAGLRIRGDF
jgi:hypothetical protein